MPFYECAYLWCMSFLLLIFRLYDLLQAFIEHESCPCMTPYGVLTVKTRGKSRLSSAVILG